MLKRTFTCSDLRSGPGFNSSVKDSGWYTSRFRALPAAPVLTETLLLLDLQTHQTSIDLNRFTRLILDDVGACLQILRLAGQEYGDAQGPMRIEDCISDLGVDRCLEAMSAQVSARDPHYEEILEMWTHCRQIANQSKSLAERSAEFNVLPEQAYLIGLLHTIGSLPALLDWPTIGTAPASRLTARNLSEQWSLPEFLSDYFREIDAPGVACPWTDLVRKAHDDCGKTSVDCSLQTEFRPSPPKSNSATLYPMPRSR